MRPEDWPWVIDRFEGEGGSSCPQDDGSWLADGANIRRKSAYLSQRVEDNAFHLEAHRAVYDLML
jgi:hypothetical protein